jgi:hypothetical protein
MLWHISPLVIAKSGTVPLTEGAGVGNPGEFQ